MSDRQQQKYEVSLRRGGAGVLLVISDWAFEFLVISDLIDQFLVISDWGAVVISDSDF